jgi:hypothetical protein
MRSGSFDVVERAGIPAIVEREGPLVLGHRLVPGKVRTAVGE